MIINNNNNNSSGSCGCGCHCHAHKGGQTANEPEQPPPPILPPELTELFKRHDRKAMVMIAGFLGWSGAHYFHFGKPLLGALHLLASLIGISGFMLGCILSVLTHSLIFLLPLVVVPLLPISIAAGVFCSLYWSMKTDEDFQRVYPDCPQ